MSDSPDSPWGDDKLVLGLTGGIGCGKSTLLQLFADRGWETVSTDAIVGELLANDAGIADAIGKEFGEGTLLLEGGVDKGELATLVFSDSSKRRWLEKLIHPFVREKWISQVSCSPGTRHIVEIPLLFENHLESHFFRVISVFCSQKIQLERLTAKGMTTEAANARISTQMPMQEKVDRSDAAFFNDGDLAHLEAQLEAFLAQLDQD